MSDPWSTPPPRRATLRHGNVATDDSANSEPQDTGFESEGERLRRVMRTRPAESWYTRSGRALTGLFRSNELGQQLLDAAVGAQIPVTTGRRIAVVGMRGGAGKTTATALLARVYSTLRQDPVAALDTVPQRGTLLLRLGLDSAPTLEAVAAAVGSAPPSSLTNLTQSLAPAGKNLWTATGERTQPGGAAALEPAAVAISRFMPIAIYDAAGMEESAVDHGAAATLAGAHVVIFVTTASVAGLDDARWFAQRWSQQGNHDGVQVLTLVTEPDARSPFKAEAEAQRLTAAGIPAWPLQYDRHLASGAELQLGLLSTPVRLQATKIASAALTAATAVGRA